MQKRDAVLVLEDGRRFVGLCFGAPLGARQGGAALGEAVFNTSMTGYQEILSDPSYAGQLVVFTAAHIGNYGVCVADEQHPTCALAGLVVHELCAVPSNFRAEGTLADWLTAQGVAGIAHVDTRAVTRHLRSAGAMRGGIFPLSVDDGAALAAVRASPRMEGQNLASEVSRAQPAVYEALGLQKHRLVLLDLGVKQGIVDCLTARGAQVLVLPATTTAREILSLNPDGVVLSNGPGDPAPLANVIATARALIGKRPLFGICLGHQLLGLALGARTYKLPFGHHGGNHPVLDKRTGALWITAQNHGFAVDPQTLPRDSAVEVTHVSLYDGTLEGFADAARQLTAIQFHPEGAPGPSDATAVFDRFLAQLERRDPNA